MNIAVDEYHSLHPQRAKYILIYKVMVMFFLLVSFLLSANIESFSGLPCARFRVKIKSLELLLKFILSYQIRVSLVEQLQLCFLLFPGVELKRCLLT